MLFFHRGSGDDGDVDGEEEVEGHSFCILSDTMSILSQIENLEDLLKEKDNQLELARSKLNAVQAQTYTSEGTLTSLEEALTDRDKQGRDLVFSANPSVSFVI